METGGAFVTVDVHYLGSGGARAAAVVAADARFCEVVAEHTEDVAEVLPYRPGEFYLRELPPIHAVLGGLSGLGLLVADGYADLDPGGQRDAFDRISVQAPWMEVDTTDGYQPGLGEIVRFVSRPA